MSVDFRALCAELAQQLDDALDFTVSSDTRVHMKSLITRARAALAQSEGKEPSDDDLRALASRLVKIQVDDYGCAYNVLPFARAILARWGCPTPQPIPVSERLPGEGDCDAEGQCWRFYPISESRWGTWCYSRSSGNETHCLPHWALPLPQGEGAESSVLQPADLSHLSDEDFFALCPQGHHAP
jgi:hypothetical protein